MLLWLFAAAALFLLHRDQGEGEGGVGGDEQGLNLVVQIAVPRIAHTAGLISFQVLEQLSPKAATHGGITLVTGH